MIFSHEQACPSKCLSCLLVAGAGVLFRVVMIDVVAIAAMGIMSDCDCLSSGVVYYVNDMCSWQRSDCRGPWCSRRRSRST